MVTDTECVNGLNVPDLHFQKWYLKTLPSKMAVVGNQLPSASNWGPSHNKEFIYAWYCKCSQKPVAGEVMGPGEVWEPTEVGALHLD